MERSRNGVDKEGNKEAPVLKLELGWMTLDPVLPIQMLGSEMPKTALSTDRRSRSTQAKRRGEHRRRKAVPQVQQEGTLRARSLRR
jgi:hypothetical protein